MSLAAQKFIAGAIHDAMQVHARRQKQPPARLKEAGYDVKDKRPALLTEDLAEALLEVHSAHGQPLLSWCCCYLPLIIAFQSCLSKHCLGHAVRAST